MLWVTRRSHRLVTLVVVILVLACDGRDLYAPRLVSTDDSRVPRELRSAYREDAARLTLREILSGGGPAIWEVELPEASVEHHYEALIRVFNLQHAARDAVVERYRIHTFPSPSVRRLQVRTVADWASAWARGEALTGDPAVDALVSAYGLRVVWHYHSPNLGHVVILESPFALNMEALGRLFREIPGVSWAGGETLFGDGADITGSRAGEELELEFSVGWGDCPSGCINRHFWSFLVQADGAVRFLGGRGDPLPPPDRLP